MLQTLQESQMLSRSKRLLITMNSGVLYAVLNCQFFLYFPRGLATSCFEHQQGYAMSSSTLNLQAFEESDIKKEMLSGKLEAGVQIWTTRRTLGHWPCLVQQIFTCFHLYQRDKRHQ